MILFKKYFELSIPQRIVKKNIMVSKMKNDRVSSPKNESSVINYSPSCHSKSVRPLFIFGTQIKIFLVKYERFLTLHTPHHNASEMFKVQKGRKEIVKIVHVTSVVQA